MIEKAVSGLSNAFSVLQRLENRFRPLGEEQITRQVDRIFSSQLVTDKTPKVDMEPTFVRLNPSERADRLFFMLSEYRSWQKQMRGKAITLCSENADMNTALQLCQEEDPFEEYCFEEMRGLWLDKDTRDTFLETYEKANIDFVNFKQSALGSSLNQTEVQLSQQKKQHEDLTQTLFLDSNLSKSKQMAITHQLENLVYYIDQNKKALTKARGLDGMEHFPENTDMVAMYEHARLLDMRKQLTDNNFIWFDSMTANYQEALMSLTNGRWPLFIGEAGTGKSALAVATAKVLTGERPTLVACTPRTNEGHLIARMALAGDKTYEEYGAAMQAATGFDDSRPESYQTSKTGRIVRLDELFKLGENSPIFAFLKELAQLKPGDIYRKREILKGFKILATTNPSGTRYNNPEPNPAFLREFSPIEVDYLKMSQKNPELYELMLVSLMDERGLIAGCAREELAPAYNSKPADQELSDGRKVIAEQELITDPTDPNHGYLYRLAYAIRSVQDAFIYGNGHQAKEEVLRTMADGSLKLGKLGELMTLSTSTITPGDIRDWLEKFLDRRKDQHPIGKTKSLTEYLQEQLKLYVEQARPEDKDKLQAIFKYFNVFDSPARMLSSVPLTPKNIGYLSPRVPRPVILSKAQRKSSVQPLVNVPATYQDVYVVFEDENSRLVTPTPMEIDINGKKINVKNGASFTLHGQKYKFIGFYEEKVVVDIGEGLHRLIDQLDVLEHGNFIESVAEEIFGADFIGEKAIRDMEFQCKQAGIEVQFITDGVDLSYTTEELEKAGKDKNTYKERFLVMRPSGVKFNDSQGDYDGPITIQVLIRLFKNNNPFGDGALIIDYTWYENESFIHDPLKAKYAIPTKKLHPRSIGKTWKEQVVALERSESRRKAIEIFWDTIAYYAATKQKLLNDGYDWSSTSTHHSTVFVGNYLGKGLEVNGHNSSVMDNSLGLCPTL